MGWANKTETIYNGPNINVSHVFLLCPRFSSGLKVKRSEKKAKNIKRKSIAGFDFGSQFDETYVRDWSMKIFSSFCALPAAATATVHFGQKPNATKHCIFYYFMLWLWKIRYNVFMTPGRNAAKSTQKRCTIFIEVRCSVPNPPILNVLLFATNRFRVHAVFGRVCGSFHEHFQHFHSFSTRRSRFLLPDSSLSGYRALASTFRSFFFFSPSSSSVRFGTVIDFVQLTNNTTNSPHRRLFIFIFFFINWMLCRYADMRSRQNELKTGDYPEKREKRIRIRKKFCTSTDAL